MTTRSSAAAPAMLEVYKANGRVAEQDVTVLVTGESGTGKELVARREFYQHSTRSRATFLASTARQFQRTCSRASCLGTRRAHSRERTGAELESSNSTAVARFLARRDRRHAAPIAGQGSTIIAAAKFRAPWVAISTVQTDSRLIAATHRNLQALVEEDLFSPGSLTTDSGSLRSTCPHCVNAARTFRS